MTDHPRRQLQNIIQSYGPSICDDPKRFEALLRDLCPDNRREINMLTLALRAGVVQELLDSAIHALPADELIARQAQNMHDSMGIAEPLALWTVESWAIALDFHVPVASPATTQKIPQPLVDRRTLSNPAPAAQSTAKQGSKNAGGSYTGLTDNSRYRSVRYDRHSDTRGSIALSIALMMCLVSGFLGGYYLFGKGGVGGVILGFFVFGILGFGLSIWLCLILEWVVFVGFVIFVFVVFVIYMLWGVGL